MSEASPDDFYSDKMVAARARAEGAVWLNSNFHNTVERHRMNRFIRFHPLEMIWGVLSGGLVATILFLGTWKIGYSGPFFFFFHPLLVVFYSILVGWNGRKLAHLSPLRRSTGEGTATWLRLKVKGLIIVVSKFFYSSTGSSNKYVTFAATDAGNAMIMDAEEYIGTARMPPGVFLTNPQAELDWRRGQGPAENMEMVIHESGVPVPVSGNLEPYIQAQRAAEAAARSNRKSKRGKRQG